MMMFIGQISIGRLLRLGGAGIIGVLMLVGFIRFAPDKVIDLMPDRVHTWKARIERFSDPADAVKFEPGRAVSIDGDDYQVVHAKIALARGGLFGKFPGHGQQRDFLPQAYSDFIYAIIIEEMGIVGGVFVLLLYIILLVRVGMIARRCDKLFPKFLVLGCGLLVVVQALTNMAVAVDLIPVTGQPLPLVSRGGTLAVSEPIWEMRKKHRKKKGLLLLPKVVRFRKAKGSRMQPLIPFRTNRSKRPRKLPWVKRIHWRPCGQ